jgi:hypothetical protein
MAKIFAVISVARQVDGEYVVVKPEKAFSTSEKAETHAKGLVKQYAEVIQSPTGPINCVCSRGIFEIDVEE